MPEQQVALITGAGGGIGLAAAEALAASGRTVVLADINQEAGEAAARRLNGTFIAADLSNRQGCRVLTDMVLDRFGRCDILVNNAGIQHVAAIETFPEDKWDFIINLMLTAPFLLTKHLWSSMREHGWGRIININSVHGLRASEFKAAYISAKHGLAGLTKTAALEGGPQGITVNSICPAYVRTPLVDAQIDDQATTHGIPRNEVIDAIMLKKAAVKRLIEPGEIGNLVTYLCSDAAACITGSMLTIDCGWTAG
ncbi:3-hydroxybutyrate dehydrogenase [Geothermobacter hydrogeniphilus]|uniref:D-beta-hydroxybutyrate dehydrogenase n=1 Tax=Geothermobacter hydrogeniphilus TaxID=1969733 RepID=A0A1X0XT20_9BACT|nr:3-hydroxybutyrate dehydrogenase [Geothermobacter hydrogeniphilus]ORJ56053.1 D-beta-hydroxybutyrate dehydrogenase [Geothermobacter hydrogeniphilus]